MLDKDLFQACVAGPASAQLTCEFGSDLKYLNESADTFYQIFHQKS